MTHAELITQKMLYNQLHQYQKGSVFDKNGKTINFDWKKYRNAADEIGHYYPGLHHNHKNIINLYNSIRRDSFMHIPNGVYYCHILNNMLPFLLFRNNTIHQICGLYESDIKDDVYDYYYALSIADKYMEGDVVDQYIVAMYDNYYYGVGTDTVSARKDLETNLFNAHRDLILKLALADSRQKVRK